MAAGPSTDLPTAWRRRGTTASGASWSVADHPRPDQPDRRYGCLAVFSANSGNSAQAAVIGAVNSALADKTAHVSLNSTTSSATGSSTMTATGDVDFSQDALQVNANVDAGGQQQSVMVVYVGGTIYEQIPAIAQYFPGKSWLSIDLSALTNASGDQGGLGSNPLATLHFLAQQGNAVTAIGSSTVDGVLVQGYQVMITSATISTELHNPNLPSWLRQVASSVTPGAATQTVYIDSSGNLRRVVTDLTETVKTLTVTVHQTADFSDLGEPVTVSVPPSDQIVTIQQLLQAGASSLGASSTS